MPKRRQDVLREQTERPTYDLRSAISELVHWLNVWMEQGPTVPAVMVQALWLINLAGVPHSGVHRKMTSWVLQLMREVAHGRADPLDALNTMKGWEYGPTD